MLHMESKITPLTISLDMYTHTHMFTPCIRIILPNNILHKTDPSASL